MKKQSTVSKKSTQKKTNKKQVKKKSKCNIPKISNFKLFGGDKITLSKHEENKKYHTKTVVFSENGKYVVSCGSLFENGDYTKHMVYIWNTENADISYEIDFDKINSSHRLPFDREFFIPVSVAVDNECKILLIGNSSGYIGSTGVIIYNLSDDHVTNFINVAYWPITSLEFSLNQNKFISCGDKSLHNHLDNGGMSIYDLDTKEKKGISLYERETLSVSFNPVNNNEALSIGTDGSRTQMTIWNWTTETETRFSMTELQNMSVKIPWTLVQETHTDILTDASFSPDGQHIVSCDKKGLICIWNSVSRQVEKELRGHDSEITSVKYNRNGSKVLSVSIDKTARIWNIGTGDCETIIDITTLNYLYISTISFNKDGTKIVVGSNDGKIYLHDVDEL